MGFVLPSIAQTYRGSARHSWTQNDMRAGAPMLFIAQTRFAQEAAADCQLGGPYPEESLGFLRKQHIHKNLTECAPLPSSSGALL